MIYKKGTFITVPNRDTLYGLKGDIQSVYLWICRFTDDEGHCFPSIKKISECSGVSKRRVYVCILELEKEKLLIKESRKAGKISQSNLYQLQLVDKPSARGAGGVVQEVQGGSARGALGVVREVPSKETYIEGKTIKETDQAEHSSADNGKLVSEIIKSFESINENCRSFYGRPPQRKACEDLIKSYTFERVRSVIEKTLTQTNKMEYFPTITTPVQLRDKWASLESAVNKKKAKLSTAKPKIIFGTPL